MMRKLVFLLVILGLIGCAVAQATEDHLAEEAVVPAQGSPEPQKGTNLGKVSSTSKEVKKPSNSTEENYDRGEAQDLQEQETKNKNHSKDFEVSSNSTQEEYGRGDAQVLKEQESKNKTRESQSSGESKSGKEDHGAEAPVGLNQTQVQLPSEQKENSTRVGSPVKQETNSTQQDIGAGSFEEKDPHCCGSRLRSCLSFSGDGSHGELSLHVESHGEFNVKINPPSFLRVDPSEFKAEKGSKTTVNIEMLDAESAKRQSSAKISVDSEDGLCEIELPSSRSSLVRGFNYSTMRTPVVGFGMLVFALVVVLGASWAYCRRKQEEGPRYHELEMGNHHQDNEASTNLEVSIPMEGWDWDDDWEESEARKSLSSAPSMSSRGLAPRKTTKEGWED